ARMSRRPPARVAPGRARRRLALTHLLAPARLAESLRLNAQPPWRNGLMVGAQVALATALAFGLGKASAWPDLAGFACLGALAALFGRFEPRGQRLPTVLRAMALLVVPGAALSALTLSGAAPLLLLLTLAACCGALALLAQPWRLGVPGAVIFVFAASAGLAP